MTPPQSYLVQFVGKMFSCVSLIQAPSELLVTLPACDCGVTFCRQRCPTKLALFLAQPFINQLWVSSRTAMVPWEVMLQCDSMRRPWSTWGFICTYSRFGVMVKAGNSCGGADVVSGGSVSEASGSFRRLVEPVDVSAARLFVPLFSFLSAQLVCNSLFLSLSQKADTISHPNARRKVSVSVSPGFWVNNNNSANKKKQNNRALPPHPSFIQITRLRYRSRARLFWKQRLERLVYDSTSGGHRVMFVMLSRLIWLFLKRGWQSDRVNLSLLQSVFLAAAFQLQFLRMI